MDLKGFSSVFNVSVFKNLPGQFSILFWEYSRVTGLCQDLHAGLRGPDWGGGSVTPHGHWHWAGIMAFNKFTLKSYEPHAVHYSGYKCAYIMVLYLSCIVLKLILRKARHNLTIIFFSGSVKKSLLEKPSELMSHSPSFLSLTGFSLNQVRKQWRILLYVVIVGSRVLSHLISVCLRFSHISAPFGFFILSPLSLIGYTRDLYVIGLNPLTSQYWNP